METLRYIRTPMHLLLVVACLPTTLETFQVRSSHFYTLGGYLIANASATAQLVASATTATNCAAFCVQDANCKTAEFDTETNTCLVLDTSSYNENIQFISSSRYVLMAKAPLQADLASGGEKLIFRGTPHIGVPMYRAWLGEAPSTSGPAPPIGCTRRDAALPCDSHYRDPFVDEWSNVIQVNMRLYKESLLRASLSFDGSGADNRMWMAKDKLLSASPWTDMVTESQFHSFSMLGSESPDRRFYINSVVMGCMFDKGWLFVSDEESDYCSYVKSAVTDFPRILFTNQSVKSLFQNHAEFADSLMVYVVTQHG